MRIAKFKYDGGIHLGAVLADELALLDDRYDDLLALLNAGEDAMDAIRGELADAPRVPLGSVALLAPIARPPKYIGIGFNTKGHIEEGMSKAPEAERREHEERLKHLAAAFPEPRWPIMFNKQTSSVSDPFAEVWAPCDTPTLDYEGEVAIVIGRVTRRATIEGAKAAIAGYMVANDYSVRDWQANTSQMWLGKSFETHGPIGPWMTTADDVEEAALEIRTYVNGELRQKGSLAEQLYSPCELVAKVSSICTLEPGDLICTGTPAGVGASSGKYLVAGDTVRVEVSGLGAIENVVVPEPEA